MTLWIAGAALFALIVVRIRARRRLLPLDGGTVSRSWLVQHRAGAEADHRFPS